MAETATVNIITVLCFMALAQKVKQRCICREVRGSGGLIPLQGIADPLHDV